MRFTETFTAFCIAASAVALPVDVMAQDVSVMDAALRRVGNSLRRLDSAMRNTRPRAGDSVAATRQILTLDYDHTDELRYSAGQIRRGPYINAIESTTLIQTTEQIQQLTRSVVNGWFDIKRMVQQAGMQNQVLNQLYTDSEAVAEFADAMMGKMPLTSQMVAQTFKNQVLQTIESAIIEYRRN